MSDEVRLTAIMNSGMKQFFMRARQMAGLMLGCWLLFTGAFAQESAEELLAIIRQEKGDTNEVIALNQLFRQERRNDPEQAHAYLEKALNLAEKLTYRRGLAGVYRSYGNYYIERGEAEKAKEALLKSQELYEAMGDRSGVNGCLNGLGNLAQRQGDQGLALDYYLQNARIHKELGDQAGLGAAFQNIGGIHYQLGNLPKAREYIEQAIDIREALGDSSELVISLNSLCLVFSAQGDHEEALAMQRKTMPLVRKFGDLAEYSFLLNNVGVQHHFLNNLDSARYYYLEALALDKKIDHLEQVPILYFNLGELASLDKQWRKAIAYFDSSLAVAEKAGSHQVEAAASMGLASAYKQLGNYPLALEWTEKSHALNDSFAGLQVKMQLNELQTRYETEVKDRKIAELSAKEAEARSVAERRRYWMLVALLGALAVLVIFVFYLERRKALENQRRAELEQRALRAQMNPHFIFNSLGAIQQMYMSGETDLANNYLGDFSSLMRKILENSGHESISVKEELEMLRLYLDLEMERANGRIEYAFEVDERVDKLGTQIPPMVIQPFVENAIWHGILPGKKKGFIRISLKPGDRAGILICTVEDDGLGIREGSTKRSHEPKGIHITEQRLGRKVKFENLSPGTRVTIEIPV